jgi:cobalamin biosynthesis protein CobC
MTDVARALAHRFAVHGGRLGDARAAFPDVTGWVDLSTGVAPWAYPCTTADADNRHLPNPCALAALEAAAASAFGAAPERVVAVPGSDLALRLLGAILPGGAAVVGPGFSGHRLMWGDRGAVPVAQGDLTGAIEACDVMILARPNNPDGWVADAQMLHLAGGKLAAHSGVVIVDEAFVDATPDDSLAASDWPGLVVLRSFGKFFGLPGLRLGFVIAPPAMAKRLRALIGDWPVSAPAISAGCAAYADTDWQAAQRERLAAGSARLRALLTQHGLAIVGSIAFFTLVASPHRDALFEHLAHAGLLTRPFADQRDWLRFGLPGAESEWQQLGDALRTWRPQ